MSLDFLTKKDRRFCAIIQARMGATRLPGKVLFDLGGKPIIEHVVSRIQSCNPDKVILAIPVGTQDDSLAFWASDNDVEFVRGSEMNVLSRFKKAIELCDSDYFIRVTGDNPFVDPEIVTRTVKELQRENADFAVMEETPLGTTVEAFTRDAFSRILEIASLAEEFEHVTLAVWYNTDKFKIHVINAPSHLKCDGLRLTIDTQKDYELACLITKSLAGDLRTPMLRDIIKYVEHNPLVKRINVDVEQQLGKVLREKKSKVIHSGV